MAIAPALSFGLDLGQFSVPNTPQIGLDAYLLPDGLYVQAGLPYYIGLGATTFGDSASTALINSFFNGPAQTLTTAEMDNINLAAGEKLVIDYDFEADETQFNDYAFSLLRGPSGSVTAILLGDVQHNITTGATHYSVAYNILTTGVYNLMFGAADLGDMQNPSALVVHSVSIQVPAGSYAIGGSGVTLGDGTVLRPNGSAVLPSAVVSPLALSGAGALLVSTAIADNGAGLISQDGNGLISQDGNGIVAAGGGNIVAAGGGNIVAAGGGNIVSHDGGSVVSHDGGSLISQDGNGLISQDGNGIVAAGGGNALPLSANAGLASANAFHVLDLGAQAAAPPARVFSTTPPPGPPPGPGVPGTEFIVGPAATTYRYPYTYPETVRVAALSSGKFAVAWVDTQAGGYPEQAIKAALVNADGTPAATTVTIPVSTLVTLTSNVGVAALPGGGFAIAYGEYDQSGVPPYGTTPNLDVRLFDASGNAVGGAISLGAPITSLDGVTATSLSDGSFAILESQHSAGEQAVQRVSASGVAEGPPIVVSASGNTNYLTSAGNAIVGLPGGAMALAYVALNPPGSSAPGLFYQVINADGSLNAPVLVPGGGKLPAMAVLANGNIALATAVALSADAQATRVQILTPAGAAVGTATTGPYADIGADVQSTIAALSDGRFMVAYQSVNAAQPTTPIVEAQIYNADATPYGALFQTGSTYTFGPAAAQLTNGTVEVVSLKGNLPVAGNELVSDPIIFSASSVATVAAQSAQQGVAVDGYISGATVFADANGNGALDAGEASATTDSLGRFRFSTTPSGPLVMTGGTDTSTGLAFTETLTAPAGSLTVTPLTTLIQKIVAANGGDLQLAQRQVNAEFGLPAATDLTAMDPVYGTTAGYADGTDAFVDGAIVADSVALDIAAGATGDVYGALALQIAINPASFDVTSAAAMQAVGLTGTAAADTAALAQASKALLTQAQTADVAHAQALLLTGAAIEKLAQGATSQALTVAVATQTFAPVLAAYTGAALASAVTDTPVLPSGGAPTGAGGPTLTGAGASATTDTVLGADNVIRSIPFATAALASAAAPLLAATTPTATLAIDAGGAYAMSATNTAAVDDATAPVTLIGGTLDRETIAAGAGAFAFQAGSGAGTLIAGGGADSVYLPFGANWTIDLGNGADTVVAVTGNDTIATGTGGSFVFLGTGATSLASAGADTILGSFGAATVSATGANADELFALAGPLTFIAGTGASTVVSGASAATLFGGTGGGSLLFSQGPTQYVGAGGSDTLVGLSGSVTIAGGAGDSLFFGGASGNNVITSGTGNTTAFGGGTGDLLTATGSGNDLFAGIVGGETLTGAGSTGNNTFFAGFGPETLVGGAGNTALVAGAGADQLTGGSGLTLFLFINGRTVGAADTISGFDPSHDFVQLAGYGGAEATTVAHATLVNGASVIGLSDGTSITFAGVAHLNASSFT